MQAPSPLTCFDFTLHRSKTMQVMSSFNSKLFKLCRRLLCNLRLPYKRPVPVKIFRLRNLGRHRRPKRRLKLRYLPYWFFRPRRRPVEINLIGELKRMSERDWMAPYVKAATARRYEEVAAQGGVEEACRSFEEYLGEVVGDEGKMSDLMDVEEMLYCWKSLTSPVFVDLVCRFYGELCEDMHASGQ